MPMQPSRLKFTKINPIAVKFSNLLFPSASFNVYHISKFYRPCSKPPISLFYCFHFHVTFISEQASEAEVVMLFLQANESVSRFPCLSPFFYPSTISYFLFLSVIVQNLRMYHALIFKLSLVRSA